MRSLLSRLAFWWAALAVGLSVLLPSPLGSWVAALAVAAAAVSLLLGRGGERRVGGLVQMPVEIEPADWLETAAMVARGAAHARGLPEALHAVARVLHQELGAHGVIVGRLGQEGRPAILERFTDAVSHCPVPVRESISALAAGATSSQRVARGDEGGFAVPVCCEGRAVAWLEFKRLEVAVATPTMLRLLELVHVELSAVAERSASPVGLTGWGPARREAPAQADCCSVHAEALVPAHPPSPPHVLDQNTLDRLRRLDPNGVNHLLERVVRAFEASAARGVLQLREGARTGDLAGVREVAHSLRSASASIGALKLSQLCADIETQIRANEPKDLVIRVKAMVSELDLVLDVLRSLPVTRT